MLAEIGQRDEKGYNVVEVSSPGVQRDVESGDASVGGGKVAVICRSDGDTRHGLETLLAGGQSGRS